MNMKTNKTLDEIYASLSRIEKRKMILKEADELVKNKKTILERGNYFYSLGKFDRSTSLQKALKSDNTHICQVCEMGNLMCSYISINNDFTIQELNSTPNINYRKFLPFSELELRTLEAIFEKKVIDYTYHYSEFLILISDLEINSMEHLHQILLDNNTDFSVIVDLARDNLEMSSFEKKQASAVRKHFKRQINKK